MKSTLFVRINERVSPEVRETKYAGPLSQMLEADDTGAVIGGGTKFSSDGRFEYVYLELLVNDTEAATSLIKQFFEEIEGSVNWSLQ